MADICVYKYIPSIVNINLNSAKAASLSTSFSTGRHILLLACITVKTANQNAHWGITTNHHQQADMLKAHVFLNILSPLLETRTYNSILQLGDRCRKTHAASCGKPECIWLPVKTTRPYRDMHVAHKRLQHHSAEGSKMEPGTTWWFSFPAILCILG